MPISYALRKIALDWEKEERETDVLSKTADMLVGPSLATLHGGGRGLGQGDVLLVDAVGGLVLPYLHAGAHIALAMQEEREGAGQVLAADGAGKTCISYDHVTPHPPPLP